MKPQWIEAGSGLPVSARKTPFGHHQSPRDLDVRPRLCRGRTFLLFSRSVTARYSFFIVYPLGSETFGKIQGFQQWLLEQIPPAQRKSAVGVEAGQVVASGGPRPVRRRRLASA